jgi:cytochrome P450
MSSGIRRQAANFWRQLAGEFQTEVMKFATLHWQNRPRPPAPEPLAKAPGPLKFLRLLRTSPIETLSRAHFERPIVISKTVLGDIAVVSDSNAIQHVLIENAANYRRDRIQQRMMALPMGTSLLEAEGAQWRAQRRCITPAFRPKMVEGYLPGVAGAARALVERWMKLDDGSRLDVALEMDRLMMDVLGRTLFSAGLHRDPEEILSEMRLHFAMVGCISLLDIFNMPNWIPRPGQSRHNSVLARLARVVVQVSKAREQRLAASPGAQSTDLLTVLHRGNDPSTERALHQREIEANVFTFIAAGHETSAIAITWALYLLSIDPEWRERTETEVDNELSDASQVSESLERLVATRAVIEEALRLYPPIPSINRQAIAADRLVGQLIRPGTIVIISPWVLHRHRLLWEAPDLFDPSRFLPGARAAIDRFAYLPFGAGPRTCIAASFAMQEAIILLATILRAFRLEAVPDHKVWPVHHVTLHPSGGLPLILHRRAKH